MEVFLTAHVGIELLQIVLQVQQDWPSSLPQLLSHESQLCVRHLPQLLQHVWVCLVVCSRYHLHLYLLDQGLDPLSLPIPELLSRVELKQSLLYVLLIGW